MNPSKENLPDYNRPLSIVDSCNTLEQLVYAERYVDLFKKRYNLVDDHDFNDKIRRHIFIKKMKLKNGWNNKN
jgi:hypothetical protein